MHALHALKSSRLPGQLLSLPQEVWQLVLSWNARQDLYGSIISICSFLCQAVLADPYLRKLTFSSVPLWLMENNDSAWPKTWGELMAAAEPPRFVVRRREQDRTDIKNCGKYGSYSSVSGSATFYSDGTTSSYYHEYESGWGSDYSWGCGIYFVCKGTKCMPAHLREFALAQLRTKEPDAISESNLYRLTVSCGLDEKPGCSSQHVDIYLDTPFPKTSVRIDVLEQSGRAHRPPNLKELLDEPTQSYVPTAKRLLHDERKRAEAEAQRQQREAELRVQREREAELQRQRAAAKLARETPKKGDWYCPNCNFLNFAKRDTCKNCRSGRRP